MKWFWACLVALLSSFSVHAFDPIERPTHNKGSSWTYKIVDATDRETGRYTMTVDDVTPAGYKMVRSVGGKSFSFEITRDWGGVAAVQGKLGNGKFLDFPIAPGRTWQSVAYREANGALVRVEHTFTVAEETELEISGRKFRTIKLVGEGTWHNETYRARGRSVLTVYYSPEAGRHIRVDRVDGPNYSTGGPDIKDSHILVSYELK